ncbi:hypothetical protein LZ30DRAFT_385084 [Colletotrichum cereale]|nr:hypothetical protein LZ30DRAFT_385084 [Colletotrichum cereale]
MLRKQRRRLLFATKPVAVQAQTIGRIKVVGFVLSNGFQNVHHVALRLTKELSSGSSRRETRDNQAVRPHPWRTCFRRQVVAQCLLLRFYHPAPLVLRPCHLPPSITNLPLICFPWGITNASDWDTGGG